MKYRVYWQPGCTSFCGSLRGQGLRSRIGIEHCTLGIEIQRIQIILRKTESVQPGQGSLTGMTGEGLLHGCLRFKKFGLWTVLL